MFYELGAEIMRKSRTTNVANAAGIEIKGPHGPPDPSVRSKAAIEAAVRIADYAAGPHGQDDAPDGEALFTALQTCAYWANGRSSGKRVGPMERDKWAKRWKLIRDYIVEENLGLVYFIIGRFRAKQVDWDELRSEALVALVRAVEGFDPRRGFRFSTYAHNAITRALLYANKKTRRRRARFPVEHDASFERPTQGDDWSELYADRLNRALDLNLGELTDQETAVLGWRFPTGGGLGRTLAEVGEVLGLSKERVRQIQKKALNKLREVLEADSVLQ